MDTAKRREKPSRHSVGRLRPDFDRLESRLALSATSFDVVPGLLARQVADPAVVSSISVVSTSLPTSTPLAYSPSTIAVSFDRPVDSFSLGNSDFLLVHVATDGSTTPLGSGEAIVGEAPDPDDSTGSRILLTLSKSLDDGRYQLVLSGENQLQGVDGSSPVAGGSDVVLAEFRIGLPRRGISDATDLRTVGPDELVLDDHLDLGKGLGTVNYYRFTLGPGHRWRLGLAISAVQGMPDSTLSVLDAAGRPIATSSFGLVTSPGDPFLFQGLDPGTYYVGVSARGNVPGPDGVYSFSGSIRSGLTPATGGGTFQLHLVADPADEATRVLGLRLDQADSSSDAPTGLTVQFSGPIDFAKIQSSPFGFLRLVGDDGSISTLTAQSYDASLGQLSFVFERAPMPGSYGVELAEGRTLLDLAGRMPILEGMTSGHLGSIEVPITSPGVDHLGPLYPELARSGLRASVEVGPESSAIRRFTVIRPGFYAITGLNSSGISEPEVLDAAGRPFDLAGSASGALATVIFLNTGTYTLRLSNTGSDLVQVSFTIRQKQLVFSEFLDGGVAQGAALNLRLVAPQTGFSGAPALATNTTAPWSSINGSSSPTRSIADPYSSIVNSGGTAKDGGRALAEPTGAGGPTYSSVVGLYSSTAVLGAPQTQANPISVVGSAVSPGSLALASNGPGLPPGLMSAPSRIRPGHRDQPVSTPIVPDSVPEKSASPSNVDSGLLARPSESRQADDQSLTGAEWVARVVSNLTTWLTPTTQPARSVAVAKEVPVKVASEAPGLLDEEGSSAESLPTSVAQSVGLGVVLAGAIYRYRDSLRKLLPARIKAEAPVKPSFGRPSILVGPHRRQRVRVR